MTFDIDANGIVHVSAKDKGTGKEQHITIESSTNMNKDDIDKAVREAEAYAAEDKKRRESIDTRNNADQMVYQTEKTIGELGDKISADDKSELQGKVDALKEALKTDNLDDIKAKQEDLQKQRGRRRLHRSGRRQQVNRPWIPSGCLRIAKRIRLWCMAPKPYFEAVREKCARAAK